ncbi:MinD/ParA family protein, partial [Actinotalea sp.]|uniref:MinD/ParA family ATP-binding protein n=1 Tax=Actinotalea sp. TaxID=1872145 RepID=UPI0035664FB4
HELPAAIVEEPEEDDVRWEGPTGSGTTADPADTGEPEAEGPAGAADTGAGTQEPTAALPVVPQDRGGVPRRRSVWQVDEPPAESEALTTAVPAVAAGTESAPVAVPPATPPVSWSPIGIQTSVPEESEHEEPSGTVPAEPEVVESPATPGADADHDLLADQPLPTLSDLLAARPDPTEGPAQLGWQGALRRMSGGLLRLRPGPSEQAHREAVGAVQRPLDGPRTIVVINPKGGAHKTTGTLLLAAAFGQHRGGYTLAWDNNETRGTLGWRSMPSTHQRTAVDLLQDLDRFTEGGAARVGDLDGYVRSQGSAQFDVLASDEDAASAASVDAFAFRALHRTLSRFYRVMIVDTGNNMRASNWQAAIDAADQVVIVSTVREDTAQSAAWAVDALRATGHADAVRTAVTVLSDPAPQRDAALAARLHEHFGRLTRAVVDVPYDASLVGGSPLQVERLDRRTREAWLRVAAVVAEGL